MVILDVYCIGGVWCTSFFIRDAPKNSLFCVRFRTLNKLFFGAVYWMWKDWGYVLEFCVLHKIPAGVW